MKKIKTKKIITLAITLGLLGVNVMPVFAIHDKRVIQSQVSEYKFIDVNLDWWKNYNDDLLEGYIVKAINQNNDLKITTLKVEEAKQNVKLQFSKELPNASIGASPLLYKMTGVTNTESTWGFPIMVNYEADLFLKNHDKTKSLKKAYQATKYNEKAAYITIASQVGATYFNIVKLDKLIQIQNEIISVRKQTYELMKVRNQEGITSTADLVRADKAYVLAQVDLSDLIKAREILLNSLAVLIGESPNNSGELKRISYDELMYKKDVPKEISSEVITQRPDYLAAEKMVEKAGIDVRVARKEFLPKIDILGLIFFTTSSLGASMNWTNALALIGGQAMLPVFTGGVKFANLRLSKNKYEQVLQNYYKTNLVAIQEVNDALSSLKLDDEKYRKNLKSYDMQKMDYKYMQKRHKEGVISNLDLIQQRENLLTIDKLVASSKAECYIDQISLYKAVGGRM